MNDRDRRALKVAVAVTAVATASTVGLGWGAARWIGARWAGAEASSLQALSDEGLGVSPAELAPAPPTNGADALRAAFAVLERIDPERRVALSDAMDIYGGDLALASGSPDLGRAAQARRVEEVLAEGAPLLPHLDEALRADAVCFELDWAAGYNAPQEHLMPLKELAWFLIARALVAQEAGQPGPAWGAIDRLVALCGRTRDPTLLGRLVREAVLGMAVNAIERLLELGPPPDAPARKRLAAGLIAAERGQPFHVALRCELALALASLDARTPEGQAALFGTSLDATWFRYLPSFVADAWFAKERAALARRMRRVIEAAQGAPREVQRALTALPPARLEDGVLAVLLEPAYRTAHAKELNGLARLRLARLLLDLAAEDALPESAPDGYPDPWLGDETALRYRRESDRRAVVWSVGEDGVDDGGAPREADRETWDLPLTLELPAGD